MSTKQIGGKVKIEEAERFQTLRAGRDWAIFIPILCDALENSGNTPEIQGISEETHTNAIQQKDKEIGRLQTAHTLEIEAKDGEILKLETENSNRGEKINNLEKNPLQPLESQLLIDVTPFALFALDDEIAAEQRKNKRVYSRGGLLLNNLLIMKLKGKVDACHIWSGREYREYEKQHLTPVE